MGIDLPDRVWLGWALSAGALMVGVGACAPKEPLTPRVTDDWPMPMVIARVNENSRKMDFLLRVGGISAVVTYVDESGATSLELTGILLYRKPRDLFLRLKHTLDVAMEVGSNDREYWVWQRLDKPRYWWGEHGQTDELADMDMPVRPDVLLEVLGLQDLPAETAGPEPVAFWVGSNRYELLFLRPDETGQLQLAKTIDIDRREPFLIRSIVLFRYGHPVVMAKLSDYEVVSGSDVLAPRTIHIKWLEKESSARLEFLTMKRFDKDVSQYFTSPLEQGREGLGDVVRVDRMQPTSMPDTP